jgi:hypothetical protein
MNDKLFDYTQSMEDMAYRSYTRSLLMFLVLFMVCIAFIFRAGPKVAFLIAMLSVFVFLIVFPGKII